LQLGLNHAQLSSKSHPTIEIDPFSSVMELVLPGKNIRIEQIGVHTFKTKPTSHSKINNSDLKTYISYMLLIIGTFC